MSAETELLLVLRARDDMSKVLQGATHNLEKHGLSIERLVVPAVLALTAASGAATGAAVLFAHAAMEEEVASVRLTQALKQTGVEFAGAAPEGVEHFVAALEHLSGFSRVQVVDALALLVEQTGSYTEAMVRERTAADFARGANIDLWTASKLLGKVTEENVNVLARYGIHVAKGTSETELFAIVAQKFGGQAAAYGQTAAGQWEILGNRVTDLRAKLGEALLPMLTIVAQRLTEFLENVMRSGEVEKFAQSIRGMADSFLEAAVRVGAFFANIQTVGLQKAIENLIWDVINKLREQLSKLGAKLDEMGPIGVAIKIVLASLAISTGLGLIQMFFGPLIGLLGGIAGVTARLLAGPTVGLAVMAGVALGIAAFELTDGGAKKFLGLSLSDIVMILNGALAGIAGGVILASLGVDVPIILTIGVGIGLAVAWTKLTSGLGGAEEINRQIGLEYGRTPPTRASNPPRPDERGRRGPVAPDRYADLDDVYARYGALHGGAMIDFGVAQSILAGRPFWSDIQTMMLAGGGIVNRPTLAMIGEAGPEAVIPLGRGGGGMGGVTIENHFHGAVVGLDQVADVIRETVRDAFASGGFRGLTGRRV
jgi:hypothetical protein